MALPRGYDVWIASMSQFSGHQAALDAVLTPDERSHVHQYRRGRDTPRLSRALLRLVLARYLGQEPTTIEIDRSCVACSRPHGKPRLRSGTLGPPPLEFSVAHGGDLLVLAFAARGNDPVGVDIEPTEPSPEPSAELLEFTLAPLERLRIAAVPVAERHDLFLRYWTGKEAVGKALGTGLDLELTSVTLPPLPLEAPAAVTVSDSALPDSTLPDSTLPNSALQNSASALPNSPVDLWIREVAVGGPYVCTLATGRPAGDLRLTKLAPEILDEWGSRNGYPPAK